MCMHVTRCSTNNNVHRMADFATLSVLDVRGASSINDDVESGHN